MLRFSKDNNLFIKYKIFIADVSNVQVLSIFDYLILHDDTIKSSNSAFVGSEGVFTVGTCVGHLAEAVHAVGNETTAQPTTEDTTDEGSDVLGSAGVGLDGCRHLLVTPRTHQGHGVRSEVRALSKCIVIVGFLFLYFCKTVLH